MEVLQKILCPIRAIDLEAVTEYRIDATGSDERGHNCIQISCDRRSIQMIHDQAFSTECRPFHLHPGWPLDKDLNPGRSVRVGDTERVAPNECGDIS